MIAERLETSSIEVGSSATTSDGSRTRARAIATRWSCPPRELVRVAEEERRRRREPDQRQDLGDPVDAVHRAPDPLDREGLGDGVEDRAAGVHRAVRVLEDELDPAAELLQLPPREGRRVHAPAGPAAPARAREAEGDAAGRRLQQLHQELPDRRLPAARLAHQPQALSPADGEGDAVDGVDGSGRPPEGAACDREVPDEAVDLDQGELRGRRRLGGRAPHAGSRGTAAGSRGCQHSAHRPPRPTRGGSCSRQRAVA